MYLSIIATIVGIAFIICGISGYIPSLSTNGLLFGVFLVDPIHSIADIIIGVIALVSAFRYKMDRLFFQIFGILFGILAIAGFVWKGNLFFTTVNMSDTILHLVIAVIFLILGFSAQKEGRV